MKWLTRVIEDVRRESKEIEFKRAEHRPSSPVVALLWYLVFLGLTFATLLATTIVGIPLSVLMYIGCIYLYQTYLRRG